MTYQGSGCDVSETLLFLNFCLSEAGFLGGEAGKIGRMEGRVLHRLNCDFCDSKMDRIRDLL